MMNQKKRTQWTASMLALALSLGTLAGCGSSKDTGTPPEAAQPSPEVVESAAPVQESAAPVQEAETVTVTDMAGRTVTLPAKIDKIATFGAIGVINAFVELMGCGDKICNQMTANFTKTDRWKMQYEFAPQIKDAPLLQNPDGELDMEAVLAVDPDLCLVMSKDLIEPLESNGLNVVYFDWKETDEVKEAVTLMGEALGKQELAADYLNFFDDTVTEANERTAGLAEEDKAKVLYGSVDKQKQPHIIAEWWIETAGGISVTRDAWTDNSCAYEKEDVLKWDPDVIIGSSSSVKDAVLADPLYSDVSAVKNGALYDIPTVAHVWGNRTVEQPLTIFWTMHKLYPELITTEELSEKIYQFYDHFFQYQMSDEQIAELIAD